MGDMDVDCRIILILILAWARFIWLRIGRGFCGHINETWGPIKRNREFLYHLND
jgi:hypothetical protein